MKHLDCDVLIQWIQYYFEKLLLCINRKGDILTTTFFNSSTSTSVLFLNSIISSKKQNNTCVLKVGLKEKTRQKTMPSEGETNQEIHQCN